MAEHAHTTSRRSLLAGAPAVLAPSSVATVPPGPPNLDAGLIALCAAFDVLERRYQANFADVETEAEWDIADAEADLIRAEQDPIVDAITACRPSTLAGFQAVAQSLALWDLELLKQARSEACVNDRLAAHLVGSLLGSAVA